MSASHGGIFCFGPFRLSPAKREIKRDGVPLALGDRALDILIALVERPSEIVSHRDLTARVWRDLVVTPGNLRVHMSALRKALGDGQGGARYIENVTGRGYCFVAQITRETEAAPAQRSPEQADTAARKRLMLPPKLGRMIGREQTVSTVAGDLLAERFITIIGPGGVGKTTVALAVAHALFAEFSGAVCFVDIGAVADEKLVAATTAASLGLPVQIDDAVPTLQEYLQTLRILLVFDNCEHVIDAIAMLAETISREAAGVHILATSREALRVEGEHVYWLPPLASPSPESSLQAADVHKFPAVQLFMERAAAGGGKFELTDENAPIVASICGRLEGIPLAIELAAGRAGSHSITATADLLNKDLALDWHGRRTALPRHQTLRALLDWSFGLLPELEQVTLRRLSLLIGAFTVEAASAIVAADRTEHAGTLNALDALVAKCLVSVHTGEDGSPRYRLLEITRLYAREKLHESGDALSTARRHALYFTRLLNSRHGGLIDLEFTGRAYALREHLGNIRAALEWCFSAEKVPEHRLPVELAAAAAPVFFELSLLNESCKWSAAALATLDDSNRGGRREMILQSTWAISAMWIRGTTDEVLAAITRGMQLAHPLHEPLQRLRMLATKHLFLTRLADFRGALSAAQEWGVVAKQAGDVTSLSIADLLLGVGWHFRGDQALARRHFDAGFARAGERQLQLCGNDHRVRSLIVLSRTLWLCGLPERALSTARQAVSTALLCGKPLDTCFALLFTAPVYLWCGQWDGAQDMLEQLVKHKHWPVLKPFHASAAALQGALLIGREATEQGIAMMQSAAVTMKDERLNVIGTLAACCLVQGLLVAGRPDEALITLRNARHNALRSGDRVSLPELLRLQAQTLLALSPYNEERALRLLIRSCRVARQQSAQSWELRAAIDLARIHVRRGECKPARQFLAPIYGRFTEGFATCDLQSAARLLQEMDQASTLAAG